MRLSSKRILLFFLFLSAFLHVMLYGGMGLLNMTKPDRPWLQEFELVDLSKQKNEPKGQVVDQPDKALNNEVPEKTKYLSKNNQRVEKQTVARNHGDFKNGKGKAPGEAQGSGTSLFDRFKPSFNPMRAFENHLAKEKEREKEMEQNARVAAQKPARTPSTAGGGASQTLDYIEDLDPGLETLLNTREFVYSTYYSRIRSQLNQYWGPKVKEQVTKIYKEGRSIASTENKTTKCLVTLDRRGNLLRVQLIGNSGVRELDEAAVEALRAAAPFPNPPTGMVDPDGTIKIQWHFILET